MGTGGGTARAIDVAAMVINEQHRAGRTIDKLQLQKLLYLIQGAHYVWWGQEAFHEKFRAYRNGPVVRSIEQTYRDTVDGSDPLADPVAGEPSHISHELAETVRTVLGYFGTWTGPNLERFVKAKGSPWRVTRGDLPTSANSNMVIDDHLIETWFKRHGVKPGDTPLSKRDRDAFDRLASGDVSALSDLIS